MASMITSKCRHSHGVSEIEQSAAPLKSIETEFAVDSSGFSTSPYVRWFDVK
jgi:hypothetical protein